MVGTLSHPSVRGRKTILYGTRVTEYYRAFSEISRGFVAAWKGLQDLPQMLQKPREEPHVLCSVVYGKPYRFLQSQSNNGSYVCEGIRMKECRKR